MIQAIEKKIYTPEEYLEFEVASEERHEYLDRKIKLKPGGTPNHNYIVGNWLMALRFGLKDKPYETFILNQRLWIGDRNIEFAEA